MLAYVTNDCRFPGDVRGADCTDCGIALGFLQEARRDQLGVNEEPRKICLGPNLIQEKL